MRTCMGSNMFYSCT